jgi:hypothetical protein
MSTAPVAPVAGTPAPAPKLTAIQIIEQEIGNFIKQREQAVANVHAVEGAIQAAQHLLSKLKAEAVKAEEAIQGEVAKVVDFVKKEL